MLTMAQIYMNYYGGKLNNRFITLPKSKRLGYHDIIASLKDSKHRPWTIISNPKTRASSKLWHIRATNYIRHTSGWRKEQQA